MYSHQPKDYICPLCKLATGVDPEHQNVSIYRDDSIMALISKDWRPKNPGHVLIIPISHIENIYELPYHLSDRIHRLAKHIALAFKEVYQCDGVSTRQHNEPAGNQSAWHYHLHVIPRYIDDNHDQETLAEAHIEDRRKYAKRLRTYFANNPPNLENDISSPDEKKCGSTQR